MVDEQNHSQNLTYNSLEWCKGFRMFQNFQGQIKENTYLSIYRFEWFLMVFTCLFGIFWGSSTCTRTSFYWVSALMTLAPEWTPPTYTGYTTLSRSSQYHSRLSVHAEFTPSLWTDGVPLMIGTVTIMAGLFSTEHQRWIGMLEPHSWSFSIKNLEEGGLQICTSGDGGGSWKWIVWIIGSHWHLELYPENPGKHLKCYGKWFNIQSWLSLQNIGAVFQRIWGSGSSQCPTGWWYTYPSEKYEFVSWDDAISIYYGKNNPAMFQTTKSMPKVLISSKPFTAFWISFKDCWIACRWQVDGQHWHLWQIKLHWSFWIRHH